MWVKQRKQSSQTNGRLSEREGDTQAPSVSPLTEADKRGKAIRISPEACRHSRLSTPHPRILTCSFSVIPTTLFRFCRIIHSDIRRGIMDGGQQGASASLPKPRSSTGHHVLLPAFDASQVEHRLLHVPVASRENLVSWTFGRGTVVGKVTMRHDALLTILSRSGEYGRLFSFIPSSPSVSQSLKSRCYGGAYIQGHSCRLRLSSDQDFLGYTQCNVDSAR